MSGIKSIYVDSSACVRVEEGEGEQFIIHSGVYHVPLAVQYIYMDGVRKLVKMRMGRRGMRFLEDAREWRLSDLFYADDLVLCGESGRT